MHVAKVPSFAEVLSESVIASVDGSPKDLTKSQSNEGVISFQANIPNELKRAMTEFIECHPNWDQYRLIQAALAGFLVQNGVSSRSLTRLYVRKMFSNDAMSK